MSPLLSFIVPVRHPANAADWPRLRRTLSETARSIARQDDDRWEAIVVANRGADLPELPAKFAIERVDFPPNDLFRIDRHDREAVYDAVRLDKGRRILAGLLKAQPAGYAMVVDDDDFVSRRLTGFVAERLGENGWVLRRGLIWSDGGRMTYVHRNFSSYCGSSHIVRRDLFDLPERFDQAGDAYIKRTLGSHVFIEADLAAVGTPLAPLPFPGAIYRVGHLNAHSKSRSLLGEFTSLSSLKRPLDLTRRLLSLRPLTTAVREEFFG